MVNNDWTVCIMVGEDFFNGIGSTADVIGTTAYTAVKVLSVVLVLGLIGWWLWNRKKYVYDVRLKVLQNGRFIDFVTVARAKVDDTGVVFWYVKGLKQYASQPPDKSMSFSTKARWVAEGYYDRLTGIMWAQDLTTEKDFINKIQELQNSPDGITKGTHTIDVHHQPFTTTERSLLASRISRAMQRKGKDIWSMIWQILPAVILLVLIVVILIFWNDIAKPVIQLESATAEIARNNGLIQQQNIRLYQMLTGGKGNGTSYVVQELPQDQQYFMPTRPMVNVT